MSHEDDLRALWVRAESAVAERERNVGRLVAAAIALVKEPWFHRRSKEMPLCPGCSTYVLGTRTGQHRDDCTVRGLIDALEVLAPTCSECDGTGEVHSHNPKCDACNGTGRRL